MGAQPESTAPDGPLFEGSNWTFDTMDRVYDAVEDVALNDLGLDVYPNQIEIIASEQISCGKARCTARATWGWPMRS
jgi:spore cortex formation protein SpoVR/YcgB (stage V sporulation)